MTRQWRERLRLPASAVLVLGALGIALMVGYAVPRQPMLVVAGVVLVLVGTLALTQPVLLPLLAMPLIVVVLRAGGGGVDMTVSDWMIGLAFWPAVMFAPRPLSHPMRQLLWLNALYQAATLFTVIANPYVDNAVEWVHAWLLVSGALLVGWAVGATGHARLGLSLFLVACLLLAVPTVMQGLLQYAQGNLGPVYPRWPWPMHKNFIGTLLAFAAVIAYAHPSWMGWARRAAMATFWTFVAAMLMAQSRQALVGLAVALIVVSFRGRGERRRSVLALLGILPVVALVATVARDQVAEGNVHNSWFQRVEWYEQSVAIVRERPVFGYGLRFWTQGSDAPANFQPPNVFLEVAATTGMVGLVGFLIFVVGSFAVIRRLDPGYGTVALALLVSRLVQGQFDLFWVSVGVSAPFLLIGVCLGAEHLARRSVGVTMPARDTAGLAA